jgi:hypothetical protein
MRLRLKACDRREHAKQSDESIARWRVQDVALMKSTRANNGDTDDRARGRFDGHVLFGGRKM